MGLKRALCKKLKRGPCRPLLLMHRRPVGNSPKMKNIQLACRPESIDICDTSGSILGDDHRFAENQALPSTPQEQ